MSKTRFNVIIILLISEALLLLCLAFVLSQKSGGGSNPGVLKQSDEPETEEVTDVTDVTDEPKETEEPTVEPKYPQYVLKEGPLLDPWDYQGTEWVVIGKDGYLYENGYINEYLGTAPKYLNVTDSDLRSRVDTLKYIQDELADRGIAFCVAISPSKAGSLPQYIPDFYKEARTIPEGYVRPYIRFKKFLEEKGVYFVDSQTVYKSVGMTNTFPKTGIHWNYMASFETTNAVVAEYERQTGKEVRHMASDGIQYQDHPYGSEQDIYGIVYQGKRQERQNSIVDERYYSHKIYIENRSSPKIGHTIIQGGSFTGDFGYYFGSYLSSSVSSYYYNNGGNVNINWGAELSKADFVLLEVNEQFVYNMGGNAPQWAENDVNILPLGANIIDSLADYLRGN